MNLDKSKIENLIESGHISKRKHPDENLFILNYTARTQYESLWNEHTTVCRGLIVDENYNLKSRCFNKFFNYEEVKDQVNIHLKNNEKFKVTEKLDGSLGISYWIGDYWRVATRGSFDSEQAIKANQIVQNKYNHITLDKDHTYLFEIIYKKNKICVDYGDKEDLILLAVINNHTGFEQPLEEYSHVFEVAKSVDEFNNFDYLKQLNLKNKEGFVVRFNNGFRFKIKFEDYVRLHKFVFSLSSKLIWENLKNNTEPDLNNLPDEVYGWIKNVKNDIIKNKENLNKKCIEIFSSIKTDDRKEFASAALKHRESSILFKIFDNKPYEDLLWKFVEPELTTYSN
jgi:RNA ligase